MSNDEVEMEVSSSGAKISAKGSSVSRFGDAFVDAISPFTNSLGAIGDQINFYRQENVIRALKRAKELSNETGVPLEPVHPKFLVKWVEEASLEDESASEHNLTDLWAGLLLSASKGIKPSHHYFRRILGEMTQEHYHFLRLFFVGDESRKFTEKLFDENVTRFNSFFSENEMEWPACELSQDRLISRMNGLEGAGVQMKAVELFKSSGVIPNPEESVWRAASYEIAHFERIRVVDILLRMGIIRELSMKFIVKSPEFLGEFKGRHSQNLCCLVKVDALAISLLGRDLLLSCSGEL